MSKKQWISLIAVAVVFAAGGFFGGMKYEQQKLPTRMFAGGGTQRGQVFLQGAAGGRGGMGSQFISGEVLSKDDKSFTLKMQNGSSKIIFYSASSSINKTTTTTADDIIVDGQITVTGTANSDGSLTAQNVQIRSASSTPQGFLRQ